MTSFKQTLLATLCVGALFASQYVTAMDMSTEIATRSCLRPKMNCCAEIEADFNGTFSVLESIEIKLDELTECRTVKITQEDLDLAGGTYNITTPGVYRLCSDLNWFPQFAFQSAIVINSSDVTLDFDNYVLRQADPTVAACTGVQIGVSGGNYINIKLVNGTIENISNWGIDSFQAAIHELVIDSINTYSCGYNNFGFAGGMQLDALPTSPIVDVIIRNCNFNDTVSTQTTTQQLSGCIIQNAKQVLIQNCNCNNTAGRAPSGQVAALVFNAVTGGLIDNCNFNGTTALSSNVFAKPVLINGCHEISVLNSQILDTVSSIGGFNITTALGINGGQDFVVDGCVVQNYSATGAAGVFIFELDASNVTVKNCIAQNVSAPLGFVEGYGATGNDMVFENCVAEHFTSLFGSFGFNPEICNQILIKNCQAMDIQSTAHSASAGFQTAGFVVTDSGTGSPSLLNKNIVFQDCVAQNITAPNLSPVNPLFGVGFYADATKGVEITNCISQANAYGYVLDKESPDNLPASFSTIRNNVAINNTVAGFVDDTVVGTLGTNVFSDNYAYNPGAANYMGSGVGTVHGMAAGTPIRTWNYSTGKQPNTVTDVADFTGSIAGSPVFSSADIIFTGSIDGNTLYVTHVVSGLLAIGETITGAGVTANTNITAFGTGSGLIGSYMVNNTQVVPLEAMQASPTLNVTAVASGALAPGLVLIGAGVTEGTSITSFVPGSGTSGGIGNYLVNYSQAIASETMVAGNEASEGDNWNVL